MVGRARKPVPGRRDPVQGAGELGPVGDEEREMEETGRATGAQRRVRVRDERHERDIAVRRSQLHDPAAAAKLA